jgi:hypothetical protein
VALSPIYFLRGSRAVGLEIMNVQHLAGAGCSSKARERRLFLRQRHFLMYASAIRLRLECLDAAVVIGHVRAVAFQLIELHSAPLSTRGRQDIEIGVSQSGGVAAALHNRRLATKICFASILRKSRGEHISTSLCSMCLKSESTICQSLSLGFAFSDNSRDNGPKLAKFMASHTKV